MATLLQRASDEYVSRATSPDVDADYTVHLRFRLNSLNVTQMLFSANAGTDGISEDRVTVEGSNVLRLRRLNDGGSTAQDGSGATTLTTGVDYELFVTRTGSTWLGYLNNNATPDVTAGGAAGTVAATTRMAYGSEFGSSSLDGAISDLAIWTAVLSEANRDTVTTGSASAYTTNAWGRWILDVHTALADLSGNSRDLTATGTLSTVTDPVVPSGGATFQHFYRGASGSRRYGEQV